MGSGLGWVAALWVDAAPRLIRAKRPTIQQGISSALFLRPATWLVTPAPSTTFNISDPEVFVTEGCPVGLTKQFAVSELTKSVTTASKRLDLARATRSAIAAVSLVSARVARRGTAALPPVAPARFSG